MSDLRWWLGGAVRELGGWVALAAVLAILVGLAYFAAPNWVVHDRDFPATGPAAAADRAKARSDARTAGVAVIAGLGAALAAAFAGRTYYLARRGQVSDRYSKAVERFGAGDPCVRMAALYALEQIARDSRRDHRPIMELVCAFLRTAGRDGEGLPPIDVQAACTVLARRRSRYDRGIRLDLAGADLRGVQLDGANLHGADLRDAALHGAFLRGADLRGANLLNAHAASARFDGATLRDAVLSGAELQLATLDGADLQGAELEDVQLEMTYLRGTDLRGARGLTVEAGSRIPGARTDVRTRLPEPG